LLSARTVYSFNSYTLNAGVQILYIHTVDKDQLSTLRLYVEASFKGHSSRTCGTYVFFQTTFSYHVTVPLVGVSMFIASICVCDGGVEARGSYVLYN